MMTMLDPQQRAAVTTKAQKALVVAGPGSGKTRVLTERIAYLMEKEKASPYEICAITFTRKAAQEMRTRLANRVGEGNARKMTIRTLHALALAFLNRHPEPAGLRDPITVYSDWEEQFLLKQVAREYDLYTGKAWKKVKKKEVDQYFSAQYSQSEALLPTDDYYLKDLFEGFWVRCKENNSLTYGLLLLELRSLLPQIEQYLPWRHVLIDEVQDNSTMDWIIVNALARLSHATIFAVGDQDQSIYEFRGATPGTMSRLSGYEVYKLETNYRSGPDIIQACNCLIQKNEDRIPKTMKAFKNNGSAVALYRNLDSNRLASRLYGLEECWPNMAVLSRNHALLKKLSQEMEARNIPHQYVGEKSRLIETELFRRFHAFLKLLINPYDNFSFLLVKDLIGMSDEEYQEIRTHAAERSLSHIFAWLDKKSHEWGLDSYTDFFLYRAGGLARAFQIKYMATGALPYGGEGWGWSNAEVQEVFAFLFTYLSQNPNAGVKEYLDWLATYDTQEEIHEDGSIVLSTIHAAKGLEWPIVYVYGLNEGLLPSKQAVEPEDIESERRLAFVAMSRAENDLFLVVRPEETAGKNGQVYKNPQSRFIMEVG